MSSKISWDKHGHIVIIGSIIGAAAVLWLSSIIHLQYQDDFFKEESSKIMARQGYDTTELIRSGLETTFEVGSGCLEMDHLVEIKAHNNISNVEASFCCSYRQRQCRLMKVIQVK